MPTIRHVTFHAHTRGAQRCIKPNQMALVVRYGRHLHAAGLQHFFFGKVEARRLRTSIGDEVDRLSGIVVVIDDSRTIVTVYRNQNALSRIKHKSKWRYKCAS